jgi:hypothetical protein
VHTLPDEPAYGAAASQRLQSAILSRRPLRGARGVSLGGGGGGGGGGGEAAYAEVSLEEGGGAGASGTGTGGGGGGGAVVALYSLHASTRCPAKTRLAEASALLSHARARAVAAAAVGEPLLGALLGGAAS